MISLISCDFSLSLSIAKLTATILYKAGSNKGTTLMRVRWDAPENSFESQTRRSREVRDNKPIHMRKFW